MTTLNDYLQRTQRLLRDGNQRYFNPDDLRDYINQARREVANRTQCVRIITPVSGAITAATVISGGSGYASTSTVILSSPDFPSGKLPYPNGLQATAAATILSGSISDVQIILGGAGYFQPSVSVVDLTTGASNASVVLSTETLCVMEEGQEVYRFDDVDLSTFPGVDKIIALNSISIIYSNYRYSLPMYSFSTYQAKIRQYPYQYQWVASVCAQLGRGSAGELYVYPLPSQTYQMEWVAYCTPADLETDASVEVIPEPWTDGVPYMAAYFAYMELQNFNAARFMEQQFDKFMTRYGSYASPGRAVNPYGRWSWIVALLPLLNSLVA